MAKGMISAAPKAAPQAAPEDGYAEGMAIVRKALYGAEAARDMAKALKSAQDPAQGLADAAYEMVSIADQATQGRIPAERLIQFASEVLGEVVDIATAAGVEVKGAQITKAVQIMLLRYVEGQGLDTTQLQAAMSQVDPEKVGAELDKEG